MERNGLVQEPPCQLPSCRDLQQQILKYNNNCRNAKYHLKMEKFDQYAGALDIQYSDSSKTSVHHVTVTNTTTCSDLMQTLAHLLHPKLQWRADTAEHGCFTLKQGEVEMQLEMHEKPLQIALNCSVQGQTMPTFHLKMKKLPEGLGSPHSEVSHCHVDQSSSGTIKVQRASPHPLCHTTSLPPSDSLASTPSPSIPHKHSHGKWAVSDIITRSLRVKKKPKNHTGSLPSNKHQAYTLVSPLPAEKQFTMSTVMHIYYRSSANVQHCKGVLVSEKSLTKDVIAQALERCDLRFYDPRHFGLYEVIGKWEEVNPDDDRKFPSAQRHSAKQTSNSKQVTEEFVICFERELHSSECPYNSQFYFEPSNGYSRRFELRKKDQTDEKSSLSSDAPKKGKITANCSEVSVGSIGMQSNGMYSAHLGNAFILFLRLYDRKREHLVHQLVTEQTYFVHAADNKSPSTAGNLLNGMVAGKQEHRISKIELLSPEFTQETDGICIISRRPLNGYACTDHKCQYTLEVVGCGHLVTVNGSTVIGKSTPLQFGDLVAIGEWYVFIFYDNLADQPQPKYTWEKKLLMCSQTDEAAVANAAAAVQLSSTPVPHDSHTTLHVLQATVSPIIARNEASLATTSQPVAVFQFSNGSSDTLDDSTDGLHNTSVPLHSSSDDLNGSSDGYHASSAGFRGSSDGFHGNPEDSRVSTSDLHTKSIEQSHNEIAEDQFLNTYGSAFDSDAKEDLVIAGVTERFDVASAKMKLLPAYILAMCVRYQLRTHGAAAGAVSASKASQGLQVVLWSCTQKLADRKYELHNEESQAKSMDDILLYLKPVFYWLLNTMEFYYFLSEQSPIAKDTIEGVENSTLSNLQQILVYAFQQAFYTISKVLYHTLPVMIAGCPTDRSSGHKILIGQVVDFLQAILDVLNDLQINVEVIFQLFSNLFYFINAAMFNYMVLYGKELGVFQYHSGKSLRVNLDLLEGWACQQGFRSVVLNYLVKLSSVVDLLCIPPDELLQMDWATLRQEFPVLHAAQLHFILRCYDISLTEEAPVEWMPIPEDAEDALNAIAVNESFDTGPEFYIPLLGYSLDLCQSSVEAQNYMESFGKVPNPRKSVGVVPLIEDRPSPKMPDLITKVGDSEAKEAKHPLRSGSRCSNSSAHKVQDSRDYQIHELTGQAARKPCNSLETSHTTDHNTYDKWLLSHFPKDSRIVTVPRGDKGFGVIMVEGKDNATDDSAIFVQAILPGSTASQTNQLAAGDRILAIDCQKLDGADYLIAQKYLNEAEEEVVLVLAAKS